MPPVFDPSGLPPLPPKRTPEQVEKRYQDIERSRMGLRPAKSSTSVTTTEIITPPALPSRLPQKPPRTPARTESTSAAKKLPPESIPTVPTRSALSLGMNKPQEMTPPRNVNGETSAPSAPSGPPPIPLSSRPDLANIQATKPKSQLPGSTPQPVPVTTTPSCLTCRDFSGPDKHAAKFPRESIPSLDWLATQLVTPFSSPTDQARAIFSWLHHNIAYDIVSFCNNNVQPSSPMKTITTGLAVCEGYAGLFTAIASKVGLESLVIGGHGKGAGFSPLAPGEPIPPQSSNHAWNAVKIDNDEWKLIDTCWGAGHVCIREQKYTKKFAPRHFTMGNNEFGQSHFPTNKSLFYRTDGRAQIPWEEYILGPQQGGAEPVRVYSGVAEEEGLAETKFVPANLKISTKASAHPGPTVRFQFERVCEHWDPVRNGPGKPYTFILNIHGKDGREKDYVPFETNGFFWWVDVPPQKLGAPGQTVSLYTVETVSGQTARGLTTDEYRVVKGRKAMGFGGVAAWELV